MKFVECLKPKNKSSHPDRIEVIVVSVKAQECGSLLKDLKKETVVTKNGKTDLSHLKRVKSLQSDKKQGGKDIDEQHAKKRCKVERTVQVLLGACTKNDGDPLSMFSDLISKYKLHPITLQVPGRKAESLDELKEFNKIWPTLYFHKNSEQHKKQELELSHDEICQMTLGMQAVLEKKENGDAIVLCPKTGHIISRASDEAKEQQHGKNQNEDSRSPAQLLLKQNPLCTPILLAIQGVSRLERRAAMGHGMESPAFQNGQYLCTGYDLFAVTEPSIFEAMALVHSRIRRVIFRDWNTVDGGLGGTGPDMAIHCLPGTNHHYRAFHCIVTDNDNDDE